MESKILKSLGIDPAYIFLCQYEIQPSEIEL